jgi:hypothetical protein
VILAVEDPLSEAVCRKILQLFNLKIAQVVGLQGNTFLQKNVVQLNRAGTPVFLLTDLDRSPLCPAAFLERWLPAKQRQPTLLLRVAVREIESWILAHRTACATFLGVALKHLPGNPDELPDLKLHIINISRKSSNRSIRAALVPAPRSTAQVGPQYNPELLPFVREH